MHLLCITYDHMGVAAKERGRPQNPLLPSTKPPSCRRGPCHRSVSLSLLSLGAPDPYVKVNVYYGRKRIAKKKTHVKKCTLDPVFNESFIYDIPTDLLPDISIEFLVIDFDRTTKNEVVGRLILGAHSVTASGAEHWREVCESPRKPVAKWHCLSEY